MTEQTASGTAARATCGACGERARVTINRLIGTVRVACGCGTRPVIAHQPTPAERGAVEAAAEARAAEAEEIHLRCCEPGCSVTFAVPKFSTAKACPDCRADRNRRLTRERGRRKRAAAREADARAKQDGRTTAYREGRRDLRAGQARREEKRRRYWLAKAAQIERERAARLAEIGREAA